MVVHTCDRCGKNFPKLWKLRRHRERQFQCRKKIIPKINQPTPEQATVSQVIDQGTDPKPVNPPVNMINENIHDPEAGPGLATQAHREGK